MFTSFCLCWLFVHICTPYHKLLFEWLALYWIFVNFLVTFLFAAFCNIPKIFRLILFWFVHTFFVYLIYVYDSKNCAKSVHCCICVFNIILCAWNFCFFEPNELRYKPLHLKWFSQIICCIFTVTIEKYNLNIITREFMCVLCSMLIFICERNS